MPPTRITPIPAVRPSLVPMRKLNRAMASRSTRYVHNWGHKTECQVKIYLRTTTGWNFGRKQVIWYRLGRARRPPNDRSERSLQAGGMLLRTQTVRPEPTDRAALL